MSFSVLAQPYHCDAALHGRDRFTVRHGGCADVPRDRAHRLRVPDLPTASLDMCPMIWYSPLVQKGEGPYGRRRWRLY